MIYSETKELFTRNPFFYNFYWNMVELAVGSPDYNTKISQVPST